VGFVVAAILLARLVPAAWLHWAWVVFGVWFVGMGVARFRHRGLQLTGYLVAAAACVAIGTLDVMGFSYGTAVLVGGGPFAIGLLLIGWGNDRESKDAA
jgi:hypothetical protein